MIYHDRNEPFIRFWRDAEARNYYQSSRGFAPTHRFYFIRMRDVHACLFRFVIRNAVTRAINGYFSEQSDKYG